MSFKILTTLALMLLTSCMTPGYFDSTQAIEADSALTNLIVKETATALKNSFPPAKTTLYFSHGDEALSKRIEAELRALGYAVIGQKNKAAPGQLRIGYTLDRASPNLIVLRVVAGETFQATRGYTKAPDGSYLGAGPLLIRRTPQ